MKSLVRFAEFMKYIVRVAEGHGEGGSSGECGSSGSGGEVRSSRERGRGVSDERAATTTMALRQRGGHAVSEDPSMR